MNQLLSEQKKIEDLENCSINSQPEILEHFAKTTAQSCNEYTLRQKLNNNNFESTLFISSDKCRSSQKDLSNEFLSILKRIAFVIETMPRFQLENFCLNKILMEIELKSKLKDSCDLLYSTRAKLKTCREENRKLINILVMHKKFQEPDHLNEMPEHLNEMPDHLNAMSVISAAHKTTSETSDSSYVLQVQEGFPNTTKLCIKQPESQLGMLIPLSDRKNNSDDNPILYYILSSGLTSDGAGINGNKHLLPQTGVNHIITLDGSVADKSNSESSEVHSQNLIWVRGDLTDQQNGQENNVLQANSSIIPKSSYQGFPGNTSNLPNNLINQLTGSQTLKAHQNPFNDLSSNELQIPSSISTIDKQIYFGSVTESENEPQIPSTLDACIRSELPECSAIELSQVENNDSMDIEANLPQSLITVTNDKSVFVKDITLGKRKKDYSPPESENPKKKWFGGVQETRESLLESSTMPIIASTVSLAPNLTMSESNSDETLPVIVSTHSLADNNTDESTTKTKQNEIISVATKIIPIDENNDEHNENEIFTTSDSETPLIISRPSEMPARNSYLYQNSGKSKGINFGIQYSNKFDELLSHKKIKYSDLFGKKKSNYSIWLENGKIFAKKPSESQIYCIDSQEDTELSMNELPYH